MTIRQSNILTDEETERVLALEKCAVAPEGLQNRLYLSTAINYDPSVNVFFSAYEDDALIGFLTFFIPTQEEAEITAVVHPAHRGKGVFTRLNAEARRVIAQNGIGRVLYCTEPSGEGALRWLRARGVTALNRSEYRMALGEAQLNMLAQQADASFHAERVTPQTLEEHLRISADAFGRERNPTYAETILYSTERMGFVFFHGDTPVGVFTVGVEEESPFLYGVAIDKPERGKGYGRALMRSACAACLPYGRGLRLDVDSGNPTAFRLYKSTGFAVTFQADYWQDEGTAAAM